MVESEVTYIHKGYNQQFLCCIVWPCVLLEHILVKSVLEPILVDFCAVEIFRQRFRLMDNSTTPRQCVHTLFSSVVISQSGVGATPKTERVGNARLVISRLLWPQSSVVSEVCYNSYNFSYNFCLCERQFVFHCTRCSRLLESATVCVAIANYIAMRCHTVFSVFLQSARKNDPVDINFQIIIITNQLRPACIGGKGEIKKCSGAYSSLYLRIYIASARLHLTLVSFTIYH